MDTIKLQAFCTVAELKNFSEAARQLNYTQPAISAQIRELENELKVTLFKKSGKKVELSEAGKTILPYAERLLGNFQGLKSALPDSAEQHNRTVKIGASSLPGVHLVPGLMEKAQTSYPGMSFSLTISNNYQIERMLYANQIEVGFVGRKRMQPATGALTEHLLVRDDLVAVFPPSHPLAGRSELRIEDLAGLPMILPPRNILTRRQVEERLRQLGLCVDIALEIGNTEAIKQLVEHTIGMTILCRSAVQKEAAAGRLCPVPVAGLDLARFFCLLTMENQRRSKASTEFIAFVLDKAIPIRSFPTYK
ncbi:MAG TPA: LysR family transcriptional regulator [bacterium]|nr:LysR family transcriptional regulator [bacterium]